MCGCICCIFVERIHLWNVLLATTVIESRIPVQTATIYHHHLCVISYTPHTHHSPWMYEWMNGRVWCSYFIWADSFELCGAQCNLKRCHVSILPPNNYFFFIFTSVNWFMVNASEFDWMVVASIFCRIKEGFMSNYKTQKSDRKLGFSVDRKYLHSLLLTNFLFENRIVREVNCYVSFWYF